MNYAHSKTRTVHHALSVLGACVAVVALFFILGTEPAHAQTPGAAGWIASGNNPCVNDSSPTCSATLEWTANVYVCVYLRSTGQAVSCGGPNSSPSNPSYYTANYITASGGQNFDMYEAVGTTAIGPRLSTINLQKLEAFCYWDGTPGLRNISTADSSYRNITRGTNSDSNISGINCYDPWDGSYSLSKRYPQAPYTVNIGPLMYDCQVGVMCSAPHTYYRGAKCDSASGASSQSFCTVTVNPPPPPPPTYTLSVSKDGTGAGTVSGTGISCGADCSETYNSGTRVTLVPTPGTGSVFAGWSGGGCSGTGNCGLDMTADRNVTATFNDAPPTVGSVTISAPSVVANGTNQYSITISGSDTSGAGNVIMQLALINYQGGNAGSYRGYLSWGLGDYWPATKDHRACTGGGYAGIQSSYGDTYLNLDSCTTSVSGNTRTTVFTVRFDPSFTTPVTGNDISGIVYDNDSPTQQNSGWVNFDTNFSLAQAPATPASISGSCDASLNASTTWPAVAGALSYAIRVDDTSNAWDADCSPINGGDICEYVVGTSRTWTGTYSGNYTAWVHACNGAGCSGSVATSFTCPPQPAPVVTLTPQTTLGGSTGSAFYSEYNAAWGGVVTNVSWSGTNNPTSCTVYRNGVAVSGALAYPGTTRYDIPWAERIEATTTYRVDCTNPGGTGQSNTVTFTVPPPPTAPTQTCAPSGTSVNLGWTPPGGSAVNFLRGHPNPPAWTGTCTGDELCVTDATNPYSWSVTVGSPYSWWVHNRVADGNWSSSVGGSFTCTPVNHIITFNGNGATGGSMSNQTVPDATPTNLNANGYARTGYSFTGWNTVADGTGFSYPNQGLYTALSDATLYAQWTASSYTLDVTKSGDGSVSSSPAGIDCGATCSDSFGAGEEVTVTATANPGSVFAGWSGDADCADGSLTMNGDKDCTATFHTVTGTTISCNGETTVCNVPYNATATIAWSLQGTVPTASCSISPSIGGSGVGTLPFPSGSEVTGALTGDGLYTLSCYSTAVAAVSVNVDTDPELWIEIQGDPTKYKGRTLEQGFDGAYLHWDTKKRTCNLTMVGQVSSTTPVGSRKIPIGAQTEYTLHNCNDLPGWSTSVEIEIIPKRTES